MDSHLPAATTATRRNETAVNFRLAFFTPMPFLLLSSAFSGPPIHADHLKVLLSGLHSIVHRQKNQHNVHVLSHHCYPLTENGRLSWCSSCLPRTKPGPLVLTGVIEGRKELMVSRVKPTPTRSPTNILYTRVDSTAFHIKLIGSSLCKQFCLRY